MSYSQFVNDLYHQINKGLPGEAAHLEMAPFMRPSAKQILKQGKNPRHSAVMVLFYPVDSLPHFCLTQRSTYKGAHSGQVSFPGGKVEDEDSGLKSTALRETKEEVGVLPDEINVLGELTQVYIPPSNFLVTPFMGFCDQQPEFKIDPVEVVEAFDVPITTLLDDSIVKRTQIPVGSEGMKISAPYYDINDKVVWGATAVMLAEVKAILKRMV